MGSNPTCSVAYLQSCYYYYDLVKEFREQFTWILSVISTVPYIEVVLYISPMSGLHANQDVTILFTTRGSATFLTIYPCV